ncbi:hypothetical protein F441_03498 [Phytophthora nicotianae CJ01A1]|uniref:Uncharacterized protein n=6 Tax=Phytophthora nicotianae TaxID=4792 RepID=W2QM56_PHYN3|nr:hypothetical protein PPTG_08363 [Phytophthora nicotianae INRA-310]ETI53578.1 hypothetical protein F443_03492 [Phytophthora nicotianae P1569]ETK93442.1 hypothetical protein L915_03379 [Phytophthora nicotianae]ETO82282.1 hypothetical protein F444_03546 [Phytophthora nicotianae P1976]ETP23360.1 hypothetical protein F441_03498 [Phytophthora nicotianae CJ01A1]ETP51374.1 hypothetical protein F442_03473 [Phytophthora nicotianae P10297]
MEKDMVHHVHNLHNQTLATTQCGGPQGPGTFGGKRHQCPKDVADTTFERPRQE